MSDENEIQQIELRFEDLSTSIADEISGMRAMDKVMDNLDKMLFDPEFLQTCKTEELCAIYNCALKRKSISHNFIFKMIDVGMKTSLLNRLFKLDDVVKQEEPVGVQANASKELIEAKDIVKGILDARFKGGQGVEQTLIEDVLSNDELESKPE